MVQESEKYSKVLQMLRKSKPVLHSTEDIENEVIRRISETHRSDFFISDAVDFLFGWIYIGWVRRSMIAVSVLLVIVFIYQQGIILKQINYLSSNAIINNREYISGTADELEKRIMLYKLSGYSFSSDSIKISEKQINDLLEKVNDLQIKYKNLLDLIEENPKLKKEIEKKLNEANHPKIKL